MSRLSWFVRRSISVCLLALVLMVLLIAPPHPAVALTPMPPGPLDVILEDYTAMVTPGDLGFNQFSGNTGVPNKDNVPYGQFALTCPDQAPCRLRFSWDFTLSQAEDAFTGLFFSLFGLTRTDTTFDGHTVQSIEFPEHVLDLDRVDGALNEPDGPRSYRQVCFALRYTGTEPLTLRVELKDASEGLRFTRFRLTGAAEEQTQCWDFRDPQAYRLLGDPPDLDVHRAKQMTLIVERRHEGDQVVNPLQGTFDLARLWFIADRAAPQPTTDDEWLDLVERRAAQYFLDWSSRKPASASLPQDRSTFNDLLTVGGVGFALPAYAVASERGWISRTEAVSRTLSILTILDQPEAFGPEPVGRLGYEGWLYHFLGADGRRKLNFDFETTPRNEALNTVELSSIDTGLALMGALAAQSYFDRDDPSEAQIRAHAQAVYDRVNWRFMLDPMTQQFYLGWKPDESHDGASFAWPDPTGHGGFAGSVCAPQTLDYYTDEALILALLALGARTDPPISPQVYHALALARRGQEPFIRTYPGALFTFEFLPAFLDTRRLPVPRSGDEPVTWYDNSRRAVQRAIAYAERNAPGFATYGPNAWGVSAAEGPFDEYRAYGLPDLAVATDPDQDGTVTYYAMLSAVSLGDDLKGRGLEAVRHAWQRGHWHPRFGLPDAFNDNIGQRPPPVGVQTLRRQGPWIGRALFAIDEGPMLLNIENARSGLIWRLMDRNPNIQHALGRVREGGRLEPAPLEQRQVLEAEAGTGDGVAMTRNAASGQRTVLLRAGQSRTLTFDLAQPTWAALRLRYSNDNFGPLDRLMVALDGMVVSELEAEDTGGGGHGWDEFILTAPLARRGLSAGRHSLTVAASGADAYGVELDAATVDLGEPCARQFLPLLTRAPLLRGGQ